MIQSEDIFYKKLIDNPYVYHYTSIEALFSILEGYRQNGCHALPFWAGFIFKTNDQREMELGYDTLKCILPKYEKEHNKSIYLSEVYNEVEYEKLCKDKLLKRPIDGFVEMSSIPYTISFSCKRDFLPMWSMYGDGKKGVCLKFRLSKLINCLKGNLQLCFVHYEGEEDNIIDKYLLPSLYDFDANRVSKELSIEDKVNELNSLCDCISPFVKTKDWSYEAEFRIVYHKHYGPELDDNFFKCLQLSLNKIKINDHITIPIDAKSLEEIIIGPLVKYDVVEHVLRNELNECQLYNVEITSSSIQINKTNK